MEVSCKLEWNKKTKNGLDRIPNEILHAVAKETLDMTRSKRFIPYKTGKLDETSADYGARKCSDGYCIGSFTNYASSVWKMPQSTNWTNKSSKSKWYAYTLKRYGQTIIDTAISQAWKETM